MIFHPRVKAERSDLSSLQVPLLCLTAALLGPALCGNAPGHGLPCDGGEGIPSQPWLGKITLYRMKKPQGSNVIILACPVTASAQKCVDQVVMLFREPALLLCERRQWGRLSPCAK